MIDFVLWRQRYKKQLTFPKKTGTNLVLLQIRAHFFTPRWGWFSLVISLIVIAGALMDR
jgi:hypothetical protein